MQVLKESDTSNKARPDALCTDNQKGKKYVFLISGVNKPTNCRLHGKN